MIRTFVFVVVFTAVSFPLPSSLLFASQCPCPRDATPVSAAAPLSNVRIDDLLQPLVDDLLEKSRTFRDQWQRITASPLIRVTVVSGLGLEVGAARARTEFTRYQFGSLRATIALPRAAELTELLPHEFEHILEQMEGLDLPDLARRKHGGVTQIRAGVYETARARAAGLQVVREVYGETDPAVGAALAGMRRILRALGPRSGERTAGSGGDVGGDAVPAVRPETPAHLHKLR